MGLVAVRQVVIDAGDFIETGDAIGEEDDELLLSLSSNENCESPSQDDDELGGVFGFSDSASSLPG